MDYWTLYTDLSSRRTEGFVYLGRKEWYELRKFITEHRGDNAMCGFQLVQVNLDSHCEILEK